MRGNMAESSEPGLLEMLTPEKIRCNVAVKDWRDAVQVTGDLMVQVGLTDEGYTQAMRELIEKEGPYLVIAPGIALLHARPEDHVKQPGLVVLTLSTPVNFGHSTNDPVWLVFGLAAATDKAHVKALAELAVMLSTAGSIEALRDGKDEAEILQVIQTYLATSQNQAS